MAGTLRLEQTLDCHDVIKIVLRVRSTDVRGNFNLMVFKFSRLDYI